MGTLSPGPITVSFAIRVGQEVILVAMFRTIHGKITAARLEVPLKKYPVPGLWDDR